MAEAPSVSRWPRWRRRLIVGAAIFAALYAALLVVRWVREIEPATPHPFFDPTPVIIAHRPAVLGEHSLPSYERAIVDGADILELDVRLTKDGRVVIAHDEDLSRVYGVDGIVAELSYAELSAQTAPVVPLTLREVMARFSGQRFNIELKADSDALAAAVAAIVRGRTDVLVASFHGDVLDRFRELAPRVATAASSTEVMRFYLCYLLDVPSHPDYEALQLPVGLGDGWLAMDLSDPALIDFAHRHGLAVHYWTINDTAVVARLFASGADGVMTDRVKAAVKVLP